MRAWLTCICTLVIQPELGVSPASFSPVLLSPGYSPEHVTAGAGGDDGQEPKYLSSSEMYRVSHVHQIEITSLPERR